MRRDDQREDRMHIEIDVDARWGRVMRVLGSRRGLAVAALTAATAWGASVSAISNTPPNALTSGELISASALNQNFAALVTHRYYASQASGDFVDAEYVTSAGTAEVLTFDVTDAEIGGWLDLEASGVLDGQPGGSGTEAQEVTCQLRWSVAQSGGSTAQFTSPDFWVNVVNGVAPRASTQKAVSSTKYQVQVSELPVTVTLQVRAIDASGAGGGAITGACRASGFHGLVTHHPAANVP